MKPLSELIESAAAHRLLLNWFHQSETREWVANWRLDAPIADGFRASDLVRGAEPYETLSRSLMLAIAQLDPPSAEEIWT